MKHILTHLGLNALIGTLALSQAQPAQDAGTPPAIPRSNAQPRLEAKAPAPLLGPRGGAAADVASSSPGSVSLVPRGVVELEQPGLADPYVPPAVSGPLEAGIAKAPLQEMRSRLHYSEEPDGEWVRGLTFKARASKDGFTYIPFLGSHAPRNFPVEFRLASAELGGRELALDPVAAVSRTGDRFVLDRGPVEVIYDVELDQVEQSFAVDAAGAEGDLVLRLDVQTELARRGDGAGFRFDGSLGSVRYGEATVLDGAGRQAAVPSRLEGDQLILRVPASFLRESQGLVVVDPVISTFTVDDYFGNQMGPDVAYDYSNNVYCYVYSDQFSMQDFDVYYRAMTPDGVVRHEGFIEVGPAIWTGPKVANANQSNKFLIVAHADTHEGSTIRGRLLDAGTGFREPEIVIQDRVYSSGRRSIAYRPDVAGRQWDGSGAESFCVVYPYRAPGATKRVIRRAMISINGVPGYPQTIEDSYWDVDQVAISQSEGDPLTVNRYNVAYRGVNSSLTKATTRTVQINPWGEIVSGPRAIEINKINGGYNHGSLSISDGLVLHGASPTYVVARGLANLGVGNDVYATISVCRGSVLQRKIEARTLLGHGDTLYEDFFVGGLATTANQFMLAHSSHSPLGTYIMDYSVAALSVTDSDYLAVSDPPARLGSTGWWLSRPAIASAEGGGHPSSRESAIAWAEPEPGSWDPNSSNPVSTHDIHGARYLAPVETAVGAQYCMGDTNSTGEHGFITILGDSSTTGLKQMVASNLPTGNTGYFFVGTSYTTSIQPNGGVLCVGSRIGQYYAQIIGADGTASRSLNPAGVPYWFTSTSALPGDVWNVQFWHRDNDAGFQRSNYTNAATLRF